MYCTETSLWLKGGQRGQRGRPHSRSNGGINPKPDAATHDDGGLIWFFMTVGQVRLYADATALLGGLSKAQWLLADRGHDADWFRDALNNNRINSCIPSRKSRGKPKRHDKPRCQCHYGIEIMFGRLRDSRRVTTRYGRGAKAVL